VKVLFRLAPLTGFLLLFGCSSNSTASEDIAARVNGKEITMAELEKQLTRISNPEQPAPSPEDVEVLKFQVLGQMINDRILLEMAATSGLSTTDAEVDIKFTEIKTQYTEEQFDQMLKQQKMTVEDLKDEMRRTLTLEKLVTKEITSRIEVSDAEIGDFYEKNKASYNLPETYHIAHIMVTPVQDGRITNAKRDDAKTPGEALAKASRLLREIQGGMDFGVMAREWSEHSDSAPNGGDLGFGSLDDLAGIHPKLSEAVQRMKVGETSPLIETPYGFHILKLIQRDAGGQKDLKSPQVQAQIRQLITSRKEEILRAAFSETARNRAQINNYVAERLLANAGKVSVSVPAPAPAKP
jgi:peptidyl-prolyl cis-trans isomerase SurA